MIRRPRIKRTKKNGEPYKMAPKWHPGLCEVVRYWASTGLVEREIAQKIHVSHPTIDLWKKTKPEFKQALQKGKNEADERVEQAFFKSATGYSHPDVRIFLHEGEPVVVPYTKYYPPNAFAAWKWLTIRQRERWADVTKFEINNNLTIQQNNINFEDFTMEDLLALEKMGLKRLVETNDTHKN